MDNIYTLHDCSVVSDIDQNSQYKIIAKRVTTKNLDRFYLRQINSQVINPSDLTLADLKRESGNMVEVTKEVYDLYHKVISKKSRTSFSSIQNMVN